MSHLDLDIKPYVITKPRMAGIQSVFDLAISMPHQLVDIGGGMLTGTDEQVALELVTVITNQVQSQPDDFSAGRDGLRATGGNVMGDATTYRSLLRKAGETRIAIMVDSPYHMYDQTRFSITEAGVQDAEEYKNTGSEW